MATLLKLRDWIERAARESTNSVKSFVSGEQLDITNAEQHKAVLVWFEQPSQIRTIFDPQPVESIWTVRFQVLDQCKEQDIDRDNILSKTVAIGNAMIAWLVAHQHDDNAPFKIVVGSQVDCATLWRSGADKWAGARFDLSLRSKFSSDGCDVQ